MFFKYPYIPDKFIKYAVIDGREKYIGKELNKLGINTIYTEKNDKLYDAISYHPDIIMNNVGDGDVIIPPNTSFNFVDKLKKIGLNVIQGYNILTRNYPGNIAYNVARLSRYAFHNLKYTDPILKKVMESKGIKFINVKQGYTKCNIAIVDDHSFITSDIGIYKVAIKYGFDCLLIDHGDITLKGFDYGFIGGAAGLISKDIFCLAGNIKFHKDREKIINFLKYKKKKLINLTPFQIKDIGSIIPLC